MSFSRQEPKTKNGFSIGVLLNRTPTKGEVGIEIEVEGSKLPKPGSSGIPVGHGLTAMPGLAQWGYTHDGSLRGEENAEYVLVRPIPFSDVPTAIDALWGAFRSKNSKIDDSNRTSCHVHLNCQDFHMNRLTSLMALYFAFEEVLTEWCGEHRVGNLFCLRGKDAPGLVTQVKKFIQSDGETQIGQHLHYAGMNPNALVKFGSLEFRALRGVSDPAVITDWVAILERIYHLSAEFKDPREICEMFSREGPFAFYENVLAGKAFDVKKAIGWSDDKIRDSMYEGVRIAQDLCYCRDWDLLKNVELKADPFGRDARKMARKMSGPTPIPLSSYEEDIGDDEMYDPPVAAPATYSPSLPSLGSIINQQWGQPTP